MSVPIYVSRNYTEFGPFKPAEIADFIKREILKEGDHLRPYGGDVWIPLAEWPVPKDSPPAAKKAVKKAAPAKKAVKQTAKKAAKKVPEAG